MERKGRKGGREEGGAVDGDVREMMFTTPTSRWGSR